MILFMVLKLNMVNQLLISFLKACEKFNVLPNEALVLEDSEAGIDSAYQAHIPVICIPDLKEPDEVYKERTACLLSSLDQVIEYIEKSNG